VDSIKKTFKILTLKGQLQVTTAFQKSKYNTVVWSQAEVWSQTGLRSN